MLLGGVACGRHETQPAPAKSSEKVATGTIVLAPASSGSGSDKASATDVDREIEILKSRRIASIVVEQRDLAKEWKTTPEEAIDRLQKAERVVAEGSGGVLRLSVDFPNRDFAIATCNALLQAYVESRLDREVGELLGRLTAISERIEAQGSAPIPKVLEDLQVERERLEVERKSPRRSAWVLDPCVIAPPR